MEQSVAADALALQRLYHWERTAPDRVVLTQPMGGGIVKDFTWREVMDQTRRMAAHLQGLGFEPGARIGILAKNTAHWLMADFAIWMAGHVSVPLYPTLAAGTIRQILEHSEARAAVRRQARRLGGDEARASRPGCPASACRCRHRPTVRRGTTSSRARAARRASRCATATNSPPSCTPPAPPAMPKGVMHSFATFAWSMRRGAQAAHRPTRTRGS